MSDQHAETLKYEATEIERLEAELAEAILKKKDAIIRWSRLYEEHGDVYRELAVANAKIAAVESLHSLEIRYLTEKLSVEDCTECNESFPCYTIRAILESATPEPIFIKSESAIVDPEC